MKERLHAWLGHKRIDETMLYVHVAENHRRDIPAPIIAAGASEHDPDRRIVLLLGARASHVQVSGTESSQKAVATAG